MCDCFSSARERADRREEISAPPFEEDFVPCCYFAA